ncbi:MAG: hypothetical protein AUH86_12365 [Acidobacteria bacterium 13_1_40CM_4_58_4]|nr:MAG: hypothetical protein AUH86_12365 [Acidobacteria bacterium 13_1_40CM_4_58_4]HLB89177.1 hypothetical protein [Terriglobales bacterium]
MEAAQGAYVRICEFRARPGLEEEFERIYGPEGDWVRLFKKSKSFLRTELNCDMDTKGRYITVDYFVSRSSFDEFLKEFREEYDALDRHCERVRAFEKPVGSFTNHGGSR